MSRVVPELEAIADACLGANVPGPIRVRLELLAELADHDAQVLDVDRPAPDLADQKLVGEDLARVLHQDTEHLVFARRQVDRVVAEPDDPVDEVDREIVRSGTPAARPVSCSRWRSAVRMRATSSFMPNGLVT